MSLRGLILLGMFGAVAVAGFAGIAGTEPSVVSLERSLGAEVQISRL